MTFLLVRTNELLDALGQNLATLTGVLGHLAEAIDAFQALGGW